MMNRVIVLFLTCLFAVSLSACVPNINNRSYQYCDVGRPSCLKPGVIIGCRRVVVNANTGTGSFTGSLAGALAGSSLGGCGAPGVIGTLAGAVVGGVLGNAIEQDANRQPAYEYMVRLDNGDTIAVVQGIEPRLCIREHVVVKFGRVTRVLPECMYPNLRY